MPRSPGHSTSLKATSRAAIERVMSAGRDAVRALTRNGGSKRTALHVYFPARRKAAPYVREELEAIGVKDFRGERRSSVANR